MGIMNELLHPLGKDGKPTTAENMRESVHDAIELGKRAGIDVGNIW